MSVVDGVLLRCCGRGRGCEQGCATRLQKRSHWLFWMLQTSELHVTGLWSRVLCTCIHSDPCTGQQKVG